MWCESFCSVGKDLADKISPVPNSLLSGDFEMNKTKARFHFRTIEVQEIRDEFAKVKTAKSFGIDNISSYFLKLALPFIENSLAFMFNTSIETRIFQNHGKLLGLLLFTKMEIGLISQTIALYQSYLSFQGSLKNLYPIRCISTWKIMVCFHLANLPTYASILL